MQRDKKRLSAICLLSCILAKQEQEFFYWVTTLRKVIDDLKRDENLNAKNFLSISIHVVWAATDTLGLSNSAALFPLTIFDTIELMKAAAATTNRPWLNPMRH